MKNTEMVLKIKEQINFIKGKFTDKIFNDKISELENFKKLKDFKLFLDKNKQSLEELTNKGNVSTYNFVMYQSTIGVINYYIKQSEKKINKIKSSINAYKPIFTKEVYLNKINELEKINKIKEFKSFIKNEKAFLDEIAIKLSNTNNEELREDLYYENVIDTIKFYTQK